MKKVAIFTVLAGLSLFPLTGHAGGGIDGRVVQCMSLTGSDMFEIYYVENGKYVGIVNNSMELSCRLVSAFKYICAGKTTIMVARNSKGKFVAQEEGSVVELPCVD